MKDLQEFVTQGREVFQNNSVLDDNMRFFYFVKRISVVTKRRSGIDSLVDPEQGHAHFVHVAIGQRPKTSMSIAVLGTNSGVHDNGSLAGIEKMPSFNKTLQRARTMSGFSFLINASVSGVFGLGILRIGVPGACLHKAGTSLAAFDAPSVGLCRPEKSSNKIGKPGHRENEVRQCA
jgi:hypothetical protein